MIRLNIEVDTRELRLELRKLLGEELTSKGTTVDLQKEIAAEMAPEKSKAPRSTKAEPKPDTSSAPVAAQLDQSAGAASTEAAPPSDLRKEARALGTKLIDANMAEQLKAVFAEFGATKFPEIADDKLPAFMIRCEELLAAVGG